MPKLPVIRILFFVFIGSTSFLLKGQQGKSPAHYKKELEKVKRQMDTSMHSAVRTYGSIVENAEKERQVKEFLLATFPVVEHYRNSGEHIKSIALLDAMISVASRNRLPAVAAEALYHKGASQIRKGHNHVASQSALKCLKISDSIKNDTIKLKAYNLLGNIYYHLEDYGKSKEFHAKGSELARKIDYQKRYLIASYNYCYCIIKEKKYAEGLRCLNSLAPGIRKYKDDPFLSGLNLHMESARLECRPMDKNILMDIYDNLLYLKNQKEISFRVFDKIKLYEGLARYYSLTGQLGKTKQYIDSLWLLVGKNEKISSQESRVVLLLESEMHKSRGEHEKALQLYENYMEQRVHSFKNNGSNQINELTLLYETEKKDAEINAKKLQVKLMKASNAKRQWSIVVWFFVPFALLLAVFAIYLRSKNQVLRETRKVALKAAKSKSHFIDVMTHELRTPLSTISGGVFLLENGRDQNARQDYIKAIRFASDYLNKLVENTVLLKTLGDKRTPLDREPDPAGQPFSYKELIEQVAETLAYSQNNNRLTIELDNSIPEFLIGPKMDLSRILINLVSNSDKFTYHGKITLAIYQQEPIDQNTVELTFTVRDTGQGIPDGEKKRVFEAFYSGKEYQDKEYPGMGLGLKLVAGLLEKHNSRPRLESIYGSGTSISFTLKFGVAQEPKTVSKTA